MDEHLRTIEVALGVKIAHRHEQFKVDGPKLKAKRGMEMLQALYEIAAKPISVATVQLMLAGDADMARPAPARPIWQWPWRWTPCSAARCNASC